MSDDTNPHISPQSGTSQTDYSLSKLYQSAAVVSVVCCVSEIVLFVLYILAEFGYPPLDELPLLHNHTVIMFGIATLSVVGLFATVVYFVSIRTCWSLLLLTFPSQLYFFCGSFAYRVANAANQLFISVFT
jgi:hypothetical protein